jgi:SAM-dependent methyltransferase
MNTWTAAGYREHAAFVPALGSAVFDLLAARPGERILDLGCGEGSLTERIVAAGATVVGVDTSPEFVATASARGLDVRMIDGESLRFDEEFDAVFSNAALHWMRNADAVIDGVKRALRPGGRFVGECGGHGCVAAIHVALRAVLARRGIALPAIWYFPTDVEYRAKLEAHGFVVESMALIPRPTPLPTGISGWLETFAGAALATLGASDRADALHEIEALLRPALCDADGRWTADYIRLRFVARRQD